MGSFVKYLPFHKWEHEELENGSVQVKVGSMHDRHIEPIYRWYTKKDWGKLQLKDTEIGFEDRRIYAIYKGKKYYI